MTTLRKTPSETIEVTLKNGIKRVVNMDELLMLNYHDALGFDEYVHKFHTLRALNAAAKHGAAVVDEHKCPTCHHSVITSVDPRHDLAAHTAASAGVNAFYDKRRKEHRDSGD